MDGKYTDPNSKESWSWKGRRGYAVIGYSIRVSHWPFNNSLLTVDWNGMPLAEEVYRIPLMLMDYMKWKLASGGDFGAVELAIIASNEVYERKSYRGENNDVVIVKENMKSLK
jgi:hypothetical protein